jgi:serine/threonine-protein kinase
MAKWAEWLSWDRKLSFRRPKQLDDLLREARLLPSEKLADALKRRQETNRSLAHILIERGYLDERTLADFLCDRYGLPGIFVSPQTVGDDVAGLIPREWMEEGELVPVRLTGESLTLAMANPGELDLVERIEDLLSVEVRPVVAPRSTILETLNKLRMAELSAESFFEGTPEEREALSRLFSTLDDYEVVGVIGKGGFATVFKCYQRSLDRLVAIKTISKKKVPYEPIVERFMREGKIIARLDHLNIVRVMNQGEVGDIFYIVMEYVEGDTLDAVMAGRSLRERIDVFVQICDAFAYSHERGILHRDIKPSNILVDQNSVAKILDFGIAFLEGHRAEESKAEEEFVMGTPRYMAPEQREAPETIDVRADLYSVAAVMFEIFSGTRRKPTAEVDVHEINPEVPVPLARAIGKCLAKDREARLSNVATLKEFLGQLRSQLFSPNRQIQESLSNVVAETSSDLFKERYELLSELKRQKECRVLLSEHKERHQLVLIRQTQGDVGVAEAKILSRNKHPNIGEILGVGEGKDRYVVIREYLDGGSLWDRMKQPSRNPGPQAIRTLFHVVQALDFAQGLKVFHGHLHPENILFTRDGTLKVVDFSGPITCTQSMRRFFEKGPRDPHALDRFSLGVFLFEMIAGRQYFPSQGPDGNLDYLKDIRVDQSELKDLLKRLWNIVPRSERYSDHKKLLEELKILHQRAELEVKRQRLSSANLQARASQSDRDPRKGKSSAGRSPSIFRVFSRKR